MFIFHETVKLELQSKAAAILTEDQFARKSHFLKEQNSVLEVRKVL